MNKMKKLASILLAMIMVLAMAAPAMAATITIAADSNSPVAGHTYSVYQIFTGTLNGSTLSDIKYGINYTPGEAETGNLVDGDELEAITDAAAFAKELMDQDGTQDIDGTPVATLNKGNEWKAENLADGYYLIVDDGTPAAGDSYSAYIVEVIDSVTINPKSETISSDKKIASDDYADNNSDDDSVTTDGKTSNGAVGSTVNFELSVNVPANAAGYSYYYCVLNDTLSEGLTFKADSVEVKVEDQTLTAEKDYVLYTGDDADENTFQIAMLNAKALAGKTIIVTYSATINENAVIGVEGNPNKFDVDYSNNPEYSYDDKNNNGKPDDVENIPTGKTPEKETRTYVTGVKLIKVDENGNVLTGAEFKITGDSVKYVLTSEETFAEDANGEYWKLAGTPERYTTEAPRTADQMIAKTADRDSGYVQTDDSSREGYITVSGTGYAPATDAELEDSNVQLYTLLKANGDSYTSTETKYTKTIKYTVVGDDAQETAIKVYVGADGVVYFSGLGEGVYTIKETTTPAGYNSIADITLTINWSAPTDYTNSTNCTWSATASNVTGTLKLNEEGVFEIEIVNKPGSKLPETGGMGTTVIYVAGGLLVAVAVIVMIKKRREA